MSDLLFSHMQRAVEAAQASHHPESKVGAALVIGDNIIARSNFWPPAIEERLGKIDKISNASATVHAETACLIHAGCATKGGAIFSTDPSCPNCAKNMAEAGIKHLYIDHKGFEKYYAQKRLVDFEAMTLPICAAAGIGVTKIFRKETRVEEILKPGGDVAPHPFHILPDFLPALLHEEKPWAGALCEKEGRKFGLVTPLSPSVGMTQNETLIQGSKYNFDRQPLNRLLMIAAREGFQIDKNTVYCSRVPTAREMVNAIGAGIKALVIGNAQEARDPQCLRALEILQKENILKIQQ